MIHLFLIILKKVVLTFQSALNFRKFYTHLISLIRLVCSPHMIKEHCTLHTKDFFRATNRNLFLRSEVLKKYCSHEDVWDQILSGNNKVNDEELLTDYGDGLNFKEHLLFREHPAAFRLHLY